VTEISDKKNRSLLVTESVSKKIGHYLVTKLVTEWLSPSSQSSRSKSSHVHLLQNGLYARASRPLSQNSLRQSWVPNRCRCSLHHVGFGTKPT